MQVVQAAKHSMGQDISPMDLVNIEIFAARVISLAEYRLKLHTYLVDKMHSVAPNVSALIGEVSTRALALHAAIRSFPEHTEIRHQRLLSTARDRGCDRPAQ